MACVVKSDAHAYITGAKLQIGKNNCHAWFLTRKRSIDFLGRPLVTLYPDPAPYAHHTNLTIRTFPPSLQFPNKATFFLKPKKSITFPLANNMYVHVAAWILGQDKLPALSFNSWARLPLQSTTGIAEKTVRPLKSAKAVVSAKVVVACTHKLAK